MNTHAFAIAAAALLAGTTTASANIVAEFQLGDHPGVAIPDRDYGLRYDNLSYNYGDEFRGGDDVTGRATFSVESLSDVILTVIDNGGDLDIQITGTLYGGPIDGSNDVFATVTNLYTDVEAVANGWVARDEGIVGTLDFLDDSFIDESMNAKQNGDGLSFLFLADGHRLDGDDSSYVGRGWFDGASKGHTRDWIVTGHPVPAPGAAVTALAGLGLIARRRR